MKIGILQLKDRILGTGPERGQVLVLFALGLVGFAAIVGLSVDVGRMAKTRTEMQKAADAAALAAASDLPSTTSATSTATTYASKNGAASSTIVFGSTAGANDTITVTARKPVSHTFLKLVGVSGTTISASAQARRASYSGGSGLLPWGFIASNNDHSTLLQNSCYLGQSGGVPQFKQNQACTLKFGAGTNAGGDFGSLALDGVGAATYRSTIAHGSNSTFKVGDQVEVQTGNMVGPTNQGLSDRFALPAPAGCSGNARNDVLTTNEDGTVSIRAGCEASPRIIVIPVVNQVNNPQKSTILGFAFMYLTGTDGSGGHAQVTGEFVKFVTELPHGSYDGGASGDATKITLTQ